MNKSLTIIGGFYRESCRFPRTDEFFGSGGRAAAALGALGLDVHLHTVTDSNNELILAGLAQTFQFQFGSTKIGQGLRFVYDHPLATPAIQPERAIREIAQLSINAETTLQFGMLDANVSVNSKTLIYDPQNPLAPEPCKLPEDSTTQLAYVLNGREAKAITGSETSIDAAWRLCNDFGARAVAIKEGADGALILEQGVETRIPAYRTDSVWPIGSGDVFAAAFAALWGVEGKSAAESGAGASRAAAFYVGSRTLPVPKNVIQESIELEPLLRQSTPLRDDEYHVYLAGPFFTMAQLWLVEETKFALQNMGLRVFSPFHEIGIGKAKDVAPKDIAALRQSRVVLDIIDGLDAGTVYEVGFARALNKAVIVFAECTNEEPLKMMTGTDCEIVRDFSSAIYRTVWASR